jgi:hypothetical protein
MGRPIMRSHKTLGASPDRPPTASPSVPHVSNPELEIASHLQEGSDIGSSVARNKLRNNDPYQRLVVAADLRTMTALPEGHETVVDEHQSSEISSRLITRVVRATYS